MAEQSKRTGSSGRFGARYGRVARRRVAEIEETMRAEHECPDCGEERVGRNGTGIWECDACGYTFTGGAYRPQTPAGGTVTRSIRAALAEDEN
jgi:large subunit ribosomal protein L37Ae